MKVVSNGLAILITAILFQCSQSSTTSSEQDSLAVSVDSLEEEHFISTPNASFSFKAPANDDADDVTLFEAFQKGFLESHAGDDSVVFESHEFYSGDFFSQGICASRNILELRLNIPSSGSQVVNWFVLDEVNPGWYAVYDPITEDITEAQDETSADFSIENHLNECPVMTVTYKTEGGDIDFHSSEVITFYSVDAAGFNEILKIELDNTTDREGYVEGDTTEATYERRSFTILTNKTNKQFDIQVDYDNGSEKKTEVYAWNGTIYSLKLD